MNHQHLENLNFTLTSVANIVVSIITYCPYEDSLKVKVINNGGTCVNLNNDTTYTNDTSINFSKWALPKDTLCQSICYWGVWSHYIKLLRVIYWATSYWQLAMITFKSTSEWLWPFLINFFSPSHLQAMTRHEGKAACEMNQVGGEQSWFCWKVLNKRRSQSHFQKKN